MYNTALLFAQGTVAGVIASQRQTLDDLEIDINRQVVEAFNGPGEELHGRVRKLKRLYKKRKGLLKQQDRPHIHFGGKFYRDQAAKGWKKAYEDARNDRVSSIGSSDEMGGNSTLQLKAVSIDGKLQFAVRHACLLVGQFQLKSDQGIELAAILAINHQPFTHTMELAKQGKRQGQLVARKVTAGRVPLQVTLLREDNGPWYAKVTYFNDQLEPKYLPVGAIGVDLNRDSIADTWVQMADGSPLIRKFNKRMFDPDWSKAQKKAWIYEQTNEIVRMAKANHLMLCLEYLDFEGSKRWLRTKLGAMLRGMPYRQIRKAFERRCMEHGVILRYVKPQHTSLLGAVLEDYPNLGRDQAAAAIIGLRGLEEGNQWLEKRCQELLTRERSRLRINRKSKFGCTVMIAGGLIDRQLEDKSVVTQAPTLDKSATAHRFQTRAGRAINDLSKAMGSLFYQEERLPNCWKRSGGQWITDFPRPAVGPGTRRSLKEVKCSTLSI
jgi:IS605 OrfB family transposase